MKVLCINGLWTPSKLGAIQGLQRPEKGKIYHVINLLENPLLDGKNYYYLQGFIDGFEISHFEDVDDTIECLIEELQKPMKNEIKIVDLSVL